MMAANIGACQGESSRSSWQGSRKWIFPREQRPLPVVDNHSDNFQMLGPAELSGRWSGISSHKLVTSTSHIEAGLDKCIGLFATIEIEEP